MRIFAGSEEEAQALADSCHAYLIATDPTYAASVAAGQTVRWAIPAQEDDQWFIPVEPRCFGAFTEAQLLQLDDEGKALASMNADTF